MQSIILGIVNEYELPDFDNGFPIMVRHFALWMELLIDVVLSEATLAKI